MARRGACGPLGCRNRLIFIRNAGLLPNELDDMKKEPFNNVTGPSVTVSQTVNFVFGVYRNGNYQTAGNDYTLVGKTFTFVVALVNDNIEVVYN